MLSQRILNVLKPSRNKVSQSFNVQLFTTSARVLNEGGGFNGKMKLPPINPVDPEENKSNLVKDNESSFMAFFRSKAATNPWELYKLFKNQKVEFQIEGQRFNNDRNRILGPNQAVAYFLLFRGGKVKFEGHDKWFELNKETNTVDIPNTFDPKWIVTDIDASEIKLYYEALENFRNLVRVKSVNFAKSPLFDDWYADKISTLFPNLEYLNISGCDRLTERGLEGFYRCGKLKTLIVTNNYKSAAFELTCMMLEDCIPGLTVKILEPEKEIKPRINMINEQ